MFVQNMLGIRQIQTKYISDLDVPLHIEPYKCWVLYVMFVLLSLSFIVFLLLIKLKQLSKFSFLFLILKHDLFLKNTAV